MSCYLNFYLKDKKTNEYKNFLSFSSNNDLFQEIDENFYIKYFSEGKLEDNVTKIELADFDHIINNISKDIYNIEHKIIEYEKHCNGNIDIINDIVQLKDYLKEKIEIKNKIELLSSIELDCVNDFTNFSGLYITKV